MGYKYGLPIQIDLPEGFLEEEVRFDYLISKPMKELWAVELDLYFELKRVCDKYNLRLLADAGTILGAVRDKGFIPWDDDLDFSMSRDEYKKLCDVASKEFRYPYFWQTEETDPGSCRGHGQLRNSETTGILTSEADIVCEIPYNLGIFIDVFPYDNVPDDERERHNYLKIVSRTIRKTVIYRDLVMGFNRSSGLKKYFKDFLINTYFYGKKYENIYYEKLENLKLKYFYQHTALFANLLFVPENDPDKLVRPKKWFIETITVPFEFTEMNIPNEYEAYLTKAYGDWHKRIKSASIHGGLICDTHKSYKDYISEITTIKRGVNNA